MGRTIKIKVECDYCGKTEEIIWDNKSEYREFPKSWGALRLTHGPNSFEQKKKEPNYLLCKSCITAFGTWWSKK